MLDLEKITDYHNKLIANQTYAEKWIEQLLKELKIHYEFQYPIAIKDNFFFLDFYLFKTHSYLEIDGKQHRFRKQKRSDEYRRKVIKKTFKLKEIRIPNSKAIKLSAKALLDIIHTKRTTALKTKRKSKNRYSMSPIDRALQNRYDKLRNMQG
jgi:very-short-patch-repair endonuclease